MLLLQMKEANENVTLKSRLLELNKANESEKKQLEVQMSSIITSQAGQLQQQKVKISSLQKALQDELSISLNRIAEQEKEIKWLKKALSDTAQQVPLLTHLLAHLLAHLLTHSLRYPWNR
jgi:predicted  nucleic acid-binding Zn-ribbon protein